MCLCHILCYDWWTAAFCDLLVAADIQSVIILVLHICSNTSLNLDISSKTLWNFSTVSWNITENMLEYDVTSLHAVDKSKTLILKANHDISVNILKVPSLKFMFVPLLQKPFILNVTKSHSSSTKEVTWGCGSGLGRKWVCWCD